MRTEVYEPLTRTLYDRKQQEVDVSHILIRVAPDAPPEDTLEALRTMQSLADSLRQGVPFEDLAYRHSDAPPAQQKGERGFRGRLGYVRAGQLVEPFEKRMYSVPTDSVSDIFRTRYGYHLLKVHDRRPARPPVRLSHIMLRPDTSSSPRAVLDSLRTEIVRHGAPFDSLAQTYSEDPQSASNGGDLGMLESLESLPSSFRDAVTQLDSVGAVSPVVETRFGYHLIKLTDRKEQPSYEEAYEDLKDQIEGRPRVERRKAAFAQSVRSEAGVRIDTAAIVNAAPVSSLDTLSRPLLSLVDADAPPEEAIATLGDSTFTLIQLARHVMNTDGGAQMTVGEVLDDFLDQKAFRHAEAQLERRDPSFAAEMQEYREGLLAFEFMEDSVWTAAAQDTSGLRHLYRQNREQYRFPERVRTAVFRAPTDSLLTPYTTIDSDSVALSALVKRAAADSLVRVDTAMVTDSSSAVYRRVLDLDDHTAVGPIEQNGESLVLIRDTVLLPRQKTFEEARSSLVQDYQNQYEEKVLSRLRRKYEVTTYPERLRRAFTHR
jgi:peptidyl-prolyl cis-trans isomerase SurA